MNWERLISHVEGKSTEQEKQEVETWLAASAQNRLLYEQVEQQQQQLGALVQEEEVGQQWQRVQQSMQQAPVRKLSSYHWLKMTTACAAVVLVAFLTGVFFTRGNASNNSMVSIASTEGLRKKAVLPDGTVVWLHYQSSLTYDSLLFNKEKRNVELIGDAFFDVAKNRQKPFIIKSGKLNVEVVGTSFGVYGTGETQQVKVATGIVNVTAGNMNEQLFAGNAISYNMLTGQMHRSNVNMNEAVALKGNTISFDKDNLITIAQKLQHWYHKKVTVMNNVKKPVSFTGIVQDDGMETVLKGLGYMAGFTYKVNSNEIIIYPQH